MTENETDFVFSCANCSHSTLRVLRSPETSQKGEIVNSVAQLCFGRHFLGLWHKARSMHVHSRLLQCPHVPRPGSPLLISISQAVSLHTKAAGFGATPELRSLWQLEAENVEASMGSWPNFLVILT